MDGNKLFPCPEWAKYLTVLHAEDLTYNEFLAIKDHLDSCPTCAATRREYLALAHTLAQDVPSDPPSELPLRLQHTLQSTKEVTNIPINRTEKDEQRQNIGGSIDTPGFDETLYREVRMLFNVQKPLEENQNYRHS